MRLCFVCGEYPPAVHGGIGSMVQTLGRALVEAGHLVRVLGLYPRLSTTVRETDRGVDVWRLPEPTGKLRWVEGRRQLFRQVAAWARRGEIDLVEVPDWQGWAAYWPVLPIPVVTRLNGSATYFAAEMGRRPHWLTTRLEHRSLRRSDFWSSVSHYTATRTKALYNLESGPDAILPNAVSLIPPSPFERRLDGMVVFTGTLTEKKGIVPLIDAWHRIAERHPGARLHIVGKDGQAPGGSGSMTDFLRSRLAGCSAERVTFHGHLPRERVVEMLRDARVAIFPSFAEAFAIAPLEAMSAGCPTIGSALGSGPELIEDGVDGLTVDPRSLEAIEAAVSRLLSDPAGAERLAKNGQRTVQTRFSVDQLLLANIQFFRKCITAHTAASPFMRSRVIPPDAGGIETRVATPPR